MVRSATYHFRLLQFTICVHIKYLHMADNNTLLSYFSQGQDNEMSIFTSKTEQVIRLPV